MPYIVTTKRPAHQIKWPETRCVLGYEIVPESVSRQAVATLEEAQMHARQVAQNTPMERPIRARHIKAALVIPESGGTVGPLPDGTTIQVEPTTKQALFDALPLDDKRRLPTWPLPTLAMIITAFNAKHAHA